MGRGERARAYLEEPVDAASVAAFRVAFGLVMAASALRFVASGWIERNFVQPTFFFKYYGFSAVEVLSEPLMRGAFYAMAVLGLMIAAGLFYRVAIVLFFSLFTYVELIDVTNYLNHYVLVSLLAFLLFFVPAHRLFSLDAKLGLVEPADHVPRWGLMLLRFQVGVVYVFAALAKIEGDFLLHGQPVQIWMGANAHVPVIGPYLSIPQIAVLLSWGGFFNDLLAVPLLSFKKTRPFGFAMIVVFHLATNAFFNIGIFPVLMPLAATLFFDPSWPRRILARVRRVRPGAQAARAPGRRERLSPALAGFLALFVVAQVLVPLRTHLYGRGVTWHEQGMRFSWRVMLRAKSGSITYRVKTAEHPKTMEIVPRKYLTDHQEREFSGQPDLILQLAHHVRDDFERRGHSGVEVYADAWVSLNGRAPARLIDPEVDLSKVKDGLQPATYITPPPTSPPARFTR